ncbi:putative transcription factor C2H2 family [Helianthus anomalus]
MIVPHYIFVHHTSCFTLYHGLDNYISVIACVFQDSWDDVDPDELSYEELIALREVVGTESRGLSADAIVSLRSVVYKAQNSQNGSSEICVICRLDYEDGDNLILLSCKHSYHSECITNWL